MNWHLAVTNLDAGQQDDQNQEVVHQLHGHDSVQEATHRVIHLQLGASYRSSPTQLGFQYNTQTESSLA